MSGPAFSELRENLRDAAAREHETRRARGRHRRRKISLIVAVSVFGAAAAAGAADLISQGSPVRDEHPATDPNRPLGADTRKLVVTAADGPAKWGVAVYRSREGRMCAVVGQINGTRVGRVTDGVFHQYPADYPGQCARLGPRDRTIDFAYRPGRTLIWGRLGSALKGQPFTLDGKRYLARPGPYGAFVFVFEGNVKPNRLRTGKAY